jgi:hypothetical protein
MKRSRCIFLTIFLFTAGQIALADGFPKLSGPYLGQKPPGTIPEVFVPGLVSIENTDEFFCLFWDQGKHLVFLRDGSGYLETTVDRTHWTELKKKQIGNHYWMAYNLKNLQTKMNTRSKP